MFASNSLCWRDGPAFRVTIQISLSSFQTCEVVSVQKFLEALSFPLMNFPP